MERPPRSPSHQPRATKTVSCHFLDEPEGQLLSGQHIALADTCTCLHCACSPSRSSRIPSPEFCIGLENPLEDPGQLGPMLPRSLKLNRRHWKLGHVAMPNETNGEHFIQHAYTLLCFASFHPSRQWHCREREAKRLFPTCKHVHLTSLLRGMARQVEARQSMSSRTKVAETATHIGLEPVPSSPKTHMNGYVACRILINQRLDSA
ncbi:hypothetical protein BKA61DRAFT_309537 [Leptodontidium sp. MPI-SDFR-AT-0119]|nr:hypothetical protein BKA61DRAFT_309537 [Leptodontidium sp. MPI-SDFR-AT-0119]